MDVLQLTPEGLYCPAGDFHIDPWRRVPRAVITHAHADHARSGMGHYYAHPHTAALMQLRLGAHDCTAQAYGARFQLGAAQVSLHPAGHVLGSAQVRVEVDGQVWCVSGDYKRAPDPTCALFEVVPCDTYISEATFGLPCYRWASPEPVITAILDWWEACVREGVPAILLCYSLGKAQRLLAELGQRCNRPIHVHPAIEALVAAYREAGVALPPTVSITPTLRASQLRGELLLAPPAVVSGGWLRRFADASVGFASGWMAIRGNRRRSNWDRGFALSDHADWPALVQTLRETGARRLLLTHGNTEALCRYLQEHGHAAMTLRTDPLRADPALTDPHG